MRMRENKNEEVAIFSKRESVFAVK